jgi:hypothetical protein
MLFRRILISIPFPKKKKPPFLNNYLIPFHTHVQGHEKACLNNIFKGKFSQLERKRRGATKCT